MTGTTPRLDVEELETDLRELCLRFNEAGADPAEQAILLESIKRLRRDRSELIAETAAMKTPWCRHGGAGSVERATVSHAPFHRMLALRGRPWEVA